MMDGFVAVNRIRCKEEYVGRFKELFTSRAHAIDRIEGFQHMYVLEPTRPDEDYLVVSHWSSEDAFKSWTGSPEFVEGHKRAFEDIRIARERGEEPPMESAFSTYTVLTR